MAKSFQKRRVARHAQRRLQTNAHACWCPIHKGSNAPKGYGHSLGLENNSTALWKRVSPGNVVETGPWFNEDGEVVDPTIERHVEHPWGNGKWRPDRRTHRLRAESRRDKQLAEQASRNPNFPPREFIVRSAQWIVDGAEVTPFGPLYKARLEPRSA